MGDWVLMHPPPSSLPPVNSGSVLSPARPSVVGVGYLPNLPPLNAVVKRFGLGAIALPSWPLPWMLFPIFLIFHDLLTLAWMTMIMTMAITMTLQNSRNCKVHSWLVF